jgi:hypothetical protein
MTNEIDSRKGNLVIGTMLVLVGLWIALERAGVLHWTGMWSLWPLILGGWGLAKFVQTPPGEPKEGLVLMTAAAWLLVSEAGYIDLSDSWPILVIAVGLIIAFNGGRRWYGADPSDQAAQSAQPGPAGQPGPAASPWDRRYARRMHRHRRTLTPLAVLGIWIAIFVGFQMSGTSRFRSFGEQANAAFAESSSDRVRLVSVMGAVTLRVPPMWTIDTGAISAMGGVRDQRLSRTADTPEAGAGPPPHLVLRGVVAMGRLDIR